ncbi:MAG: hypothetical protein U0R71_01670 [Solirubrobacterales bacterium]
MVELLAAEARAPVVPSPDAFDALANLDSYVDVAAQVVRASSS